MRDAESQRRGLMALLAGAIFLAPFLAVLLRLELGLLAMAVALTATALLLREAMLDASTRVQRPLRALVALNLVLAASCLMAAVWLLMRI